MLPRLALLRPVASNTLEASKLLAVKVSALSCLLYPGRIGHLEKAKLEMVVERNN